MLTLQNKTTCFQMTLIMLLIAQPSPYLRSLWPRIRSHLNPPHSQLPGMTGRTERRMGEETGRGRGLDRKGAPPPVMVGVMVAATGTTEVAEVALVTRTETPAGRTIILMMSTGMGVAGDVVVEGGEGTMITGVVGVVAGEEVAPEVVRTCCEKVEGMPFNMYCSM